MTQKDMKHHEGIGYFRVSSPGQGRSGLGLEAQEYNAEKIAAERGITIVAKHYEVESGMNNERPVLLKVLSRCIREGKTLIFANMSRLGRDMFFVAKIISSGVKFIAANKPDADEYEHMEDALQYAKEGRNIRKNTREGIQARLRRGLKMGENMPVLLMETRYKSQKYSRQMKRRIEGYEREAGRPLSERELMRVFILKQVRTFRGRKKWGPSLVHHVLVNIKALVNDMNQESYKILFRFISCFTEDDDQTLRIMQENYHSIVNDAASTKGNFIEDFTAMLIKARTLALTAVKNKPFAGKCWVERDGFFPLSAAMTENHKEAFCLRFYKDWPESDIADKLRLSVEQVQILLKQAFYDISTQSIIQIPQIIS